MRRRRPLGEIGLGVGTCLLGLALSVAGCGSDGGGGGPADEFAGVWRYEEGTGSLACPDNTIDETPGGNKLLARGVDTTLVDLTQSFIDSAIQCDFGFDVTGKTATARTDQTCAMTGGLEVLVFDTTKDPPDQWTFALTSAKTAEEVVQMTEKVTVLSNQIGVEPTMYDCVFTMAAHLQRISKD